jgi:hypothetical protein
MCYVNIGLLAFRLWACIDCVIIFLAPFPGNNESIFLNDTFSIGLSLKEFILQRLPGDSTEGDSLTPFDPSLRGYLATPLTFSKVPPYSQLCDISKIWDHGALGTSVSDY